MLFAGATEMSKTIDIPVQVPDWARWVAQDENGTWGVYDCEPTRCTDSWMGNGRYLLFVGSEPNPNWRETLREVA